MTKCPSKIFGSCAPNATYNPHQRMTDCLQYCTPNPCPSNLNTISSDCTQYVTTKNINPSPSGFSSIPPKCILGPDGMPSLSPFCPTGLTSWASIASLSGTSSLNRPNSPLSKAVGVTTCQDNNNLTGVCKTSYTGKISPIFQKNVDYACKSGKPYAITSTLYPKCSSYLNNIWTKCIKDPPRTTSTLCDDLDDNMTLPPQSNKPTTYCQQQFPDAIVNEATGEYIMNIINCSTTNPISGSMDNVSSSCLVQYNDTPSKAFCNKFESTPTPTPKKGLSTGAIVGIIIGSVALLIIIGVVLTRKKGKRKSR